MMREDCPQCAGYGCNWCGDIPQFTDVSNMVACPKCGAKHADGSVEAEFIGWHGECVRCQIKVSNPQSDAQAK